MTIPFDPNGRVILVPVFLAGPAGASTFQFALDTAATRTAVSGLVLESLGYSESQTTGRRLVRTGSGSIQAGALRVARLGALDQVKAGYEVFWLPLPPGTMIDGEANGVALYHPVGPAGKTRAIHPS